MEANITKYELGGIRYISVRLPNRSAVTVARDDAELSVMQLEQKAIAYWQFRDNEETVANALRQKHNRQVYIGYLPTHDIETELEGNYVYVLRNRRRHGKYQILEAVPTRPV